jgi:hypothetical protein
MFTFARSLGAPPWGRLLVSASYVFSGYYIGHAQHISVVYSFSFLPWILWRFDRALLTRRLWPAIEAGSLWGLSALAGNPAVTISTAIFVGTYGLGRLLTVSQDSTAARLGILAVRLAIFAAIGTMVLAPTYFSFSYESFGFTDRSGPLSKEVALGENTLTPKSLLAIFNPYLPMLDSFDQDSTGVNPSCSPFYFGLAPLALAGLALTSKTERRWRWSLAVVAILFLGFTLGTTLPFRGWLYDVVYPTRYFRHPNMFRGYVIMAVLVLASLATAQISKLQGNRPKGDKSLRRLAIGSACVSFVALLVFNLFFGFAKNAGSDPTPAVIHASFVGVGLMAICAIIAARPAWLRALPGGLVGLTLFDMGMASYLSSDIAFHIGTPMGVPAARHSPTELGPAGFERAGFVFGNINLYYPKPVFSSYAPMLNRFHQAQIRIEHLSSMARGSDRVWFAANAPIVPVTDDAFDDFAKRAVTEGPLIVRHRREEILRSTRALDLWSDNLHDASPARLVPFEVLTYKANELALKVNCPESGWLLVTDRWSRSWQATVNGEPAVLDCGNFIFRLLPVNAGENLVAMRFQPFLMPHLLFLSWGMLGITAVGSLLLVWMKKSRHRVPGDFDRGTRPTSP